MAGMLPYVVYALAALNLFTLLLFGWDKRRAIKGKSRTSEGTLITLSFFGGFVGGWIAMNVFRHKTRKSSFKVKMFAVTVLNPVWLALWLWLDGAFTGAA